MGVGAGYRRLRLLHRYHVVLQYGRCGENARVEAAWGLGCWQDMQSWENGEVKEVLRTAWRLFIGIMTLKRLETLEYGLGV